MNPIDKNDNISRLGTLGSGSVNPGSILFYRRDSIQTSSNPYALYVAASVTASDMLDKVLPNSKIYDTLYNILEQNILNAVEATALKWKGNQFVGAEIRCRAFVKDEELWLQIIDNGNGFPLKNINEIGKKVVFPNTRNIIPSRLSLDGQDNHLFNAAQTLEQLGGRLVVLNSDETKGACVSVVIPCQTIK